MRISTKKIEVTVHVQAHDIKNGLCRLPGFCMQKTSVDRGLQVIDTGGGDHKVRIDAASSTPP